MASFRLIQGIDVCVISFVHTRRIPSCQPFLRIEFSRSHGMWMLIFSPVLWCTLELLDVEERFFLFTTWCIPDLIGSNNHLSCKVRRPMLIFQKNFLYFWNAMQDKRRIKFDNVYRFIIFYFFNRCILTVQLAGVMRLAAQVIKLTVIHRALMMLEVSWGQSERSVVSIQALPTRTEQSLRLCFLYWLLDKILLDVIKN